MVSEEEDAAEQRLALRLQEQGHRLGRCRALLVCLVSPPPLLMGNGLHEEICRSSTRVSVSSRGKLRHRVPCPSTTASVPELGLRAAS